MPANATAVPMICGRCNLSTLSAASINSVKIGPLVKTRALEKAVEKLIPQVTIATCSVCPIRPQTTKRGRSARNGIASRQRPR